MHVNAVGGYIIPCDKLVSWWNNQAPPDFLIHDGKGDALLLYCLSQRFGRNDEGRHMYVPQVVWLGPRDPPGLRKPFVFISCDALMYLDVPPEKYKLCRVPQDLSKTRVAQLRKFLAEEFGISDARFNFEENGVRWHNRRMVC